MANPYVVLRNRLQDINRPVICELDDEQPEPQTGRDLIPMELFIGFLVVLSFLCTL